MRDKVCVGLRWKDLRANATPPGSRMLIVSDPNSPTPSNATAPLIAAPRPQMTQPSARIVGLGRVLITVYVILALAATFRSVFQIIRKFDEAPLAYSLSALAGIVYIVASIALTRQGTPWRRVAWAALSFELAGVLVVGALSFISPQWFAHPSVWSWFGAGYLYIPLVLPVLGLIWLSRTGERR
jgi:fumarate reductase subunit D